MSYEKMTDRELKKEYQKDKEVIHAEGASAQDVGQAFERLGEIAKELMKRGVALPRPRSVH